MTRLKAVSLMVAACALFTLQGRADTTYTYTGNTFNQFGGGASCPSQCSISGSFTVASPLAPNFSGFFVPTAFSFTDGTVTMTQANTTTSAFGVTTNSQGRITVWNLEFINAGTSMYTGTGPSPLCPSNCTVTDGSFSASSYASIVGSPGSWSSVKYSYTGNAFTTFFGPSSCPPECRLTGSFTVAAPLGPNFNGFFTPAAFSFTDGLVTINQANMTSSAPGVITDASGSIVVWNMGFIEGQTSIFTGTGPSAICTSSACTVTDGAFSPTMGAERLNDPGTWTGSSQTATIPGLTVQLQSFNLPFGSANSLLAKLQAAETAGPGIAACADLSDFIAEAHAQSGKKLTVAQANQLIAIAIQVEMAGGCS